MSKFKGLPDLVVNAMRGSWRDLVQAMGGVDRTSRICSMGISQVSACGSPSGDCMPTLAAIYLAEQDAGEPFISTVLASATNHILVPLKPVAEGELAELLSRVGAETGQVFARFAAALADDGAVDAAERQAIARELQELNRAALAALAHLHAGPAPVGPKQDAAA